VAHAHAAADATRFLERYAATSAHRRSRVAASAPLGALHAAALHHPDPFVRRACLVFLDHHANEASTAVFAAALRDPVELVRHPALHSVACETCRSAPLCPADVVAPLVTVLASDPSAELRHKAVPVLLRLAARDPADARARRAVERAASADPDPLVREVAALALAGRQVRSRRAHERLAGRR
jgi:hypothetical protein